MQRNFALFGPSNRGHYYTIQGGFCISAFAIITRGSEVLLVKPKENPRWINEWAPNWLLYTPELLKSEFERWRFPSSYIMEGESPDNTLRRIMEEQLRISKYEVLGSKLLNFYEPSRRYPGLKHWDYCFTYDIKTTGLPEPGPWFSEARYIDARKLRAEDFGSSQGGLAEALKLIIQ